MSKKPTVATPDISSASNLNPFVMAVHVILWLFFGSLVFSASWALYEKPEAIVRTVLVIGFNLGLFYLFYLKIVPHFLDGQDREKSLLAAVAAILAYIILRVKFESALPQRDFLLLIDYRSRFPEGAIFFSAIGLSGSASLLRMIITHQQRHTKDVEAAKSKVDSELDLLKSQMSPHFLFNTINNIYALVLEKSEQAPDALLRLSDLLRYLLYESDSKVELGKEVAALNTFAELYALRSEEKLNVRLSVEAPPETLVEPLLLIPLWENAFKHSGVGVQAEAWIEAKLWIEGGYLKFQVRNSLSQLTSHDDVGGIGLHNLRRRLQLVYPAKGKLGIGRRGDAFEALLEVPS